MSKMTAEQEKGIFKAAVVVNDEAGLPNYMTMFYMEPGTYKEEDVPEVFKVNGEIMAAILISQYTNTVINGIPVSLPYQKPVESMGHDESAAACRRKGPGWHLMTNAEWVYLMKDAAAAGHIISGNTDYGKNADNPEEKGYCYDGYTVLTGTEPLAWSHDGTPGGVFGLCGNFWERVAGISRTITQQQKTSSRRTPPGRLHGQRNRGKKGFRSESRCILTHSAEKSC